MNYKIEAISRVRELARKQVEDLNGFDYTAPGRAVSESQQEMQKPVHL